MSEQLLSAIELQKSYKERRVVHDVSLHVAKQEIIGLLGPNGAGKSTTFGMIAGLVKPDSGNVQLAHESLGHLSLDRRAKLGLGYLAQESTIFQGLSVVDNPVSYTHLRAHET